MPQGTAAATASCQAVPAPPATAESLLVGITAPADPERLFGSPGLAERFILAHAYETLTRLDCLGRARPGLAASWTTGATGMTIVLRRGAVFWSGDPVSARDVVEGWRAAGGSAAGAAVPNDSTLFLGGEVWTPERLADPAMAVRRVRLGSRWPEGTGPFRVEERAAAVPPSRGALRLAPVVDRAPSLTILMTTEEGGRDLVDHGVDLLVTEAAAVNSYARTGPDLVPLHIPWTRSWLLLTPPRVAVSDSAARIGPPAAAQEALIRDAVPGLVRTSVRAHVDHPLLCWRADRPRVPPAARADRPRIVYRAGDAVARALAERLVALADMYRSGAADPSTAILREEIREAAGLTTAGLPAREFDAALRAGVEVAYVVDVAAPLGACDLMERQLAQVAWLLAGAGPMRNILPLVDGGTAVFVRRGRAGVTMEWLGTPVVNGAPGGPGGGR